MPLSISIQPASVCLNYSLSSDVHCFITIVRASMFDGVETLKYPTDADNTCLEPYSAQ
jgi:hypothetical protein